LTDTSTPGRSLDFSTLRQANLARAKEWNPTGADTGPGFAGLELAGEVGELCNLLKKAERVRLGLVGGVVDRARLEEELADVVICADLVGIALGIDLSEAVRAKFNRTSEERQFLTRLLPEPRGGNASRRFLLFQNDSDDEHNPDWHAVRSTDDPLEVIRFAFGPTGGEREVLDQYTGTRAISGEPLTMALLKVLRANNALTDRCAQLNGDLVATTGTNEWHAAVAAEAECEKLGIDTDRWELRSQEPTTAGGAA